MYRTKRMSTFNNTPIANASMSPADSKLPIIADLVRKHLNDQELLHLLNIIGLKLSPAQTADIFAGYFLPRFPLDERAKVISKLASFDNKHLLEPCVKAYFLDGLSDKHDEVVYSYLSKQDDGTKMQLLTAVLMDMEPEAFVTLVKESIRGCYIPVEEWFELAVDITKTLSYQQQASAMQEVLRACPGRNKQFFAVKLLKTLPGFTLDAEADVNMVKEFLDSGFNLENTADIVVSGLNSLSRRIMQATENIPGLDDEERSKLNTETVKFAKHIDIISIGVLRCFEMVSVGGKFRST